MIRPRPPVLARRNPYTGGGRRWLFQSDSFVPDSPRSDLTESLHSACFQHVQRLPMGPHEQRALLSDTRSRSCEGWQGLETPRGGRGVHASRPLPVCRGLAWRPPRRPEGTSSLVVLAPQLLAGCDGRFLEWRADPHGWRDLEAGYLQRDFIGPAATPCRSRCGPCVKRIIPGWRQPLLYLWLCSLEGLIGLASTTRVPHRPSK